MLPMVSDVREIQAVRSLVAECCAELQAEGQAYAAFELGIMIETPAAALMAAELAREVAFFSIGTNDLTQYIMAADRLNPKGQRPQSRRASGGHAGHRERVPSGARGPAFPSAFAVRRRLAST